MRTLGILLALFIVPVAAQTLTPMDVHRLKTVRAAYPSPDGKHVAFIRSAPRAADDPPGGSYSNLLVVPAEGGPERVLIGGKGSVRGVAYAPNGEMITFVDRRDDSPHSEVYGLPLNGGEPQRVTKTPHGVGTYKWRPDGGAIAFTARDELPAARAKARRMGFRPVVLDEDYVNVSLWLWDAKSGECRRLTDGGTVNSFEWAPDGRFLVAGIAPRNIVDDRYMATRLHVVDTADRGGVRSLVKNPGKLGGFAVSPDGRHVAYISAADKRDPHAGMPYVVATEGGEPQALADGFPGMFHQLAWIDGKVLRAVASRGVKTYYGTIDLETGELKPSAGGQGVDFQHVDPLPGTGDFIAVGSTKDHPGEVYRFDASGGAHRLSESNPWLASRRLGRQETTRIKARDGLEIEGLLMYPVDYEEGKRYPLVVMAHGGPESHFTEGWNTGYSRWGQLLCARNWFAWYPNYRASTGYGVAFAKLDHGDPMGGEFEDHLDAIKALDARGLIDSSRVGIGGGSYGGYTAAWAATRHTKHFAAAVSFVPFVDIRTKWLTSDIPNEFYLVHYEEKWPHEQARFLAERSPLTYAPNCRTPLLLLGGTADPRVHPSQPHMLYRAVKTSTETPVRYVQYSGEGHGNRIDRNRYDYCVRTLRWFEYYLRPGDHRMDSPPAFDVDYSGWK